MKRGATNNKGFSLVELIIVIAIMAILIGVIAPQLIKYIEKTNVAADTQMCDNVRKAIYYAMMDPDVVQANDKSKDLIEDIMAPDNGFGGTNISTLDHYTGDWLTCAFAQAVTEQLGGFNPFDMNHATGRDTDFLKSYECNGFMWVTNDTGTAFAIFIQDSDRYGEKNTEIFTGEYDELEDSRVIFVK